MNLTAEQRRALHAAIVASFDVSDFRAFLSLRLDVPWDEVSGSGIRSHVVLDAIEYFTHRDRLAELVLASRDARPRNATFRSLAEEVILTPLTAPDARTLQRVVFDQVPFLDPVMWDADAALAEAPVCLIEIITNFDERVLGTGFLIAPSLVLTAHHVVAPVIDGTAARERVRLWFDRKYLRDGKTLNMGVEYRLAEGDFPAADSDLDFAVLRLDAQAGNEPLGRRNAEPGAATRGWLRFPDPPVVMKEGAPLIILQHPEGDPLKRALDMRSVAGLAADGRHLLHQTNTRAGSSGSPCFDVRWRLVAMHVGVAAGPGGYNEAVRIERIAEELLHRGVKVDE